MYGSNGHYDIYQPQRITCHRSSKYVQLSSFLTSYWLFYQIPARQLTARLGTSHSYPRVPSQNSPDIPTNRNPFSTVQENATLRSASLSPSRSFQKKKTRWKSSECHAYGSKVAVAHLCTLSTLNGLLFASFFHRSQHTARARTQERGALGLTCVVGSEV
ncbi:hypothetical protein DM02DRAFT_386491 [Periconia macrospinosa]|uniref:Uncharacterized protein n=1 Tax=Periconia macrospinosa TaxID=97972 RepID=A0A2V1DRM2_9PLEO|nr:hypothetical protein DM02DRAFT_386491 [Periconia macrospinosa]